MFQKWGKGPRLVFIPALISNVEIAREHELYLRILESFGDYMTGAQFDQRDIGLSDRFESASTMAQRNEDILATMDVVERDLGFSWGH